MISAAERKQRVFAVRESRCRSRTSGGINTWSLIRFCSDPEPFSDGRRDDFYLHSCLSTWLQQLLHHTVEQKTVPYVSQCSVVCRPVLSRPGAWLCLRCADGCNRHKNRRRRMKKALFKSKWALLKQLSLKWLLELCLSQQRRHTAESFFSELSGGSGPSPGAAGSWLSASQHLRVRNVNESVLRH